MLIFIILYGLPAAAQCSNTLSARKYDTVVTGIGYGDYTVSFPKWNADSGTLISVKVNTSVSLRYGFTLKNADVVPSTYTIMVGRVEQISSPAMSVPYSNTVEQNIGAFPLVPGAQVVKPPFSLLANYNNTDSITSAVAPFIGSGSLSFSYEPITYTDIHTNNNSSYAYSATALDTVHFSLTYTYCKVGLLAAALTHWTAEPQGPGSVLLNWGAVNEQLGRVYEIEESRDGQHFAAAGSVMAGSVMPGGAGSGSGSGGLSGGGNGYGASGSGVGLGGVMPGENDYSFVANLPTALSSAAGKWYFRLTWNDPGMNPVYSIIKMVDMGNEGRGISIYPNPANDHINLVFNAAVGNAGGGGAGSWQVDILSADGRLLQRELISNVNAARLVFRHTLAAGVYFLRAVNTATPSQNYHASFEVR